ncbi:hypothetical protein K469DRAFT_694663 [Zopfia rhizophila CBS 207.26]|uniref:Uncharacterized protein n=1 Tax=Zopfia rhizophila CBS 207.26 TaxID=1314779 RepID=A0A6A6EMS7_9PEZI|nr:hypothetical protein K469DRAFT_694663 [Zopfia rhizophila CBS 207.26]
MALEKCMGYGHHGHYASRTWHHERLSRNGRHFNAELATRNVSIRRPAAHPQAKGWMVIVTRSQWREGPQVCPLKSTEQDMGRQRRGMMGARSGLDGAENMTSHTLTHSPFSPGSRLLFPVTLGLQAPHDSLAEWWRPSRRAKGTVCPAIGAWI